jgi:hypothetical protein
MNPVWNQAGDQLIPRKQPLNHIVMPMQLLRAGVSEMRAQGGPSPNRLVNLRLARIGMPKRNANPPRNRSLNALSTPSSLRG